jgi:hypothetical protein
MNIGDYFGEMYDRGPPYDGSRRSCTYDISVLDWDARSEWRRITKGAASYWISREKLLKIARETVQLQSSPCVSIRIKRNDFLPI